MDKVTRAAVVPDRLVRMNGHPHCTSLWCQSWRERQADSVQEGRNVGQRDGSVDEMHAVCVWGGGQSLGF